MDVFGGLVRAKNGELFCQYFDLNHLSSIGMRLCTHPRFGLSLPGRGLQSGLGRVDAVLEGDNLVVELLQFGFLLLLHADRHVVVLFHH